MTLHHFLNIEIIYIYISCIYIYIYLSFIFRLIIILLILILDYNLPCFVHPISSPVPPCPSAVFPGSGFADPSEGASVFRSSPDGQPRDGV